MISAYDILSITSFGCMKIICDEYFMVKFLFVKRVSCEISGEIHVNATFTCRTIDCVEPYLSSLLPSSSSRSLL